MRLCTCVANGQLKGARKGQVGTRRYADVGRQPRRRRRARERAGSEATGRARLSRARESRTVSLIHEETSGQDVGWPTTSARINKSTWELTGPTGTEGWGGKTERTEGSDGRSGRTSPGPVCATVIYHSHLPLPARQGICCAACCLLLAAASCTMRMPWHSVQCAQVGSTGTVPWPCSIACIALGPDEVMLRSCYPFHRPRPLPFSFLLLLPC